MKRLLLILIPVAWLASCSPSGDVETTDQPLSKRQRDSTIAETEELPGSKTVGRAMEIADSAAARRERPIPESN